MIELCCLYSMEESCSKFDDHDIDSFVECCGVGIFWPVVPPATECCIESAYTNPPMHE